MEISTPVVVSGLVVGFMYALIGLGLVIEYRASRIVNFAHGAQAMVGAFLFDKFREDLGIVPAVLLAVTVVAATGLVLHRLAVDYMSRAPALNQLILTVGILLILSGLTRIFLQEVGRQYAPAIKTGVYNFFGVNLGGDQLVVIAVASVSIVLLTAFFRFTSVGLAMRAASDRPHVAEFLGINTMRMGQLAWVIGSILAGLGGVFMSPLLNLEPILFTLLIIHAYSAILVGRMLSIPLTLVGGLFLGVGQALAQANITQVLGIREIVALGVALAALMLTANKLEWSTGEELV